MALSRNRMASQHDFSMIPRADIPRSRYMLQQNRKQTFNAGDLIPIYCEEILPADQFQGNTAIFARLATPIVPVLDNAELETFFFFVPNRLIWENWEAFITGQDFEIPLLQVNLDENTVNSLLDHFGIPTTPQLSENFGINALPFRAYNLIYNEWFRDQNLTTEATVSTDDGPDIMTYYPVRKRAKKHDYFTGCLPWPQKGTAVSMPLGETAPVIPDPAIPGDSDVPLFNNTGSLTGPFVGMAPLTEISNDVRWNDTGNQLQWIVSGLVTDLADATAANINAIRTAFQIQRLLERDARGGSRYVEQILSHFGVRSPDFRLDRPEYIGGGRTRINSTPIAQTSSTDAETPQGNLAAFTQAADAGHRFSYAATEHGYIIGLANVRCDLTYQQGIRRHWFRQTRYDYYFPAFAHLGEQAVMQRELWYDGTNDATVFGYQERYAEYRYTPNEITGLFRSTDPNTIDFWHYAEEFNTFGPPVLNNTFITDQSETVLQRSLAVGAAAAGQQILLDVAHRVRATRPMPTYSVPGLIDHF